MSKKFSGGCACGAVRYAINGMPIVENHCQCLDCQSRSGTGHGSYLAFDNRPEFELKGETKQWDVAGDSDNIKQHSFCPNCGTSLFITFEAMPEIIALHAGSLDDRSQFNPQLITYTARAQPWDRIDPELPKFEKMPTS